MSVEYSRCAIADLNGISAYYLSHAGSDVARRFETRRTVIDRVAKGHGSAVAVVQRPVVRVVLMGSFPFRVFYRQLESGGIRVLHIRPMARRPLA
jgi:toxin ParE1/3/4